MWDPLIKEREERIGVLRKAELQTAPPKHTDTETERKEKEDKRHQEEEENKKNLHITYEESAKLLAVRAIQREWEAAVITTNYSAEIYNVALWRPIGWVHPQGTLNRDTSDTALHLAYRGGGFIDIKPDEVSYLDGTAKSREAIERGIMHAKSAWKGHAILLDGDDEFKATSWALAKFHDVPVKDYKPEGKFLELAEKILAERKISPSSPTQNPDELDPKRPRFEVSLEQLNILLKRAA